MISPTLRMASSADAVTVALQRELLFFFFMALFPDRWEFFWSSDKCKQPRRTSPNHGKPLVWFYFFWFFFVPLFLAAW